MPKTRDVIIPLVTFGLLAIACFCIGMMIQLVLSEGAGVVSLLSGGPTAVVSTATREKVKATATPPESAATKRQPTPMSVATSAPPPTPVPAAPTLPPAMAATLPPPPSPTAKPQPTAGQPAPTATTQPQPTAAPPPKSYPAPKLVGGETRHRGQSDIICTADGAPNHGQDTTIYLCWSLAGSLGQDEYFDIRVWRTGEPPHGVQWTKETEWQVAPSFFPGTYSWQVCVIQGKDGKVLADLSPCSETWRFIWER